MTSDPENIIRRVKRFQIADDIMKLAHAELDQPHPNIERVHYLFEEYARFTIHVDPTTLDSFLGIPLFDAEKEALNNMDATLSVLDKLKLLSHQQYTSK